MSKTVIIPECMNPFEVMIDGKYYSYPAGTTQEVPDDVAAVIESHKQTHEAQMTPPSADLPGVCLLAVDMTLRKLGVSEETKQTAILPETVVLPESHEMSAGKYGAFALPFVAMEVGKKYRVVADGVALEHIATDASYQIIGNASLFNDETDNGWPWVFVIAMDYQVTAIGFADPAENEKSHTVAVYEVTETTTPIDHKYLPGVCLPVVELETQPQIDVPVVLSEKETEQLKNALKSGDYCLVHSGFEVVIAFRYPGMNFFVCQNRDALIVNRFLLLGEEEGQYVCVHMSLGGG